MRHYDEILATARDVPAFSNGSQGYGWMARWCDRCTHDDLDDNTYGPFGCPIVAVTMMSKTPAEFLADSERAEVLADYRCIEFRDKNEPGASEPGPIPDPPGQELLLPREPFEGVRMLSQPQDVEVPA